jgi:hypothetical protein
MTDPNQSMLEDLWMQLRALRQEVEANARKVGNIAKKTAAPILPGLGIQYSASEIAGVASKASQGDLSGASRNIADLNIELKKLQLQMTGLGKVVELSGKTIEKSNTWLGSKIATKTGAVGSWMQKEAPEMGSTSFINEGIESLMKSNSRLIRGLGTASKPLGAAMGVMTNPVVAALLVMNEAYEMAAEKAEKAADRIHKANEKVSQIFKAQGHGTYNPQATMGVAKALSGGTDTAEFLGGMGILGQAGAGGIQSGFIMQQLAQIAKSKGITLEQAISQSGLPMAQMSQGFKAGGFSQNILENTLRMTSTGKISQAPSWAQSWENAGEGFLGRPSIGSQKFEQMIQALIPNALRSRTLPTVSPLADIKDHIGNAAMGLINAPVNMIGALGRSAQQYSLDLDSNRTNQWMAGGNSNLTTEEKMRVAERAIEGRRRMWEQQQTETMQFSTQQYQQNQTRNLQKKDILASGSASSGALEGLTMKSQRLEEELSRVTSDKSRDEVLSEIRETEAKRFKLKKEREEGKQRQVNRIFTIDFWLDRINGVDFKPEEVAQLPPGYRSVVTSEEQRKKKLVERGKSKSQKDSELYDKVEKRLEREQEAATQDYQKTIDQQQRSAEVNDRLTRAQRAGTTLDPQTVLNRLVSSDTRDIGQHWKEQSYLERSIRKDKDMLQGLEVASASGQMPLHEQREAAKKIEEIKSGIKAKEIQLQNKQGYTTVLMGLSSVTENEEYSKEREKLSSSSLQSAWTSMGQSGAISKSEWERMNKNLLVDKGSLKGSSSPQAKKMIADRMELARIKNLEEVERVSGVLELPKQQAERSMQLTMDKMGESSTSSYLSKEHLKSLELIKYLADGKPIESLSEEDQKLLEKLGYATITPAGSINLAPARKTDSWMNKALDTFGLPTFKQKDLFTPTGTKTEGRQVTQISNPSQKEVLGQLTAAKNAAEFERMATQEQALSQYKERDLKYRIAQQGDVLSQQIMSGTVGVEEFNQLSKIRENAQERMKKKGKSPDDYESEDAYLSEVDIFSKKNLEKEEESKRAYRSLFAGAQWKREGRQQQLGIAQMQETGQIGTDDLSAIGRVMKVEGDTSLSRDKIATLINEAVQKNVQKQMEMTVASLRIGNQMRPEMTRAQMNMGMAEGYLSRGDASEIGAGLNSQNDQVRQQAQALLQLKKQASDQELQFTKQYLDARLKMISMHYDTAGQLEQLKLTGTDTKYAPQLNLAAHGQNIDRQMMGFRGTIFDAGNQMISQGRKDRSLKEQEEDLELNISGLPQDPRVVEERMRRNLEEAKKDNEWQKSAQNEQDKYQLGSFNDLQNQMFLGEGLPGVEPRGPSLRGTAQGRQMLMSSIQESIPSLMRQDPKAALAAMAQMQGLQQEERAFGFKRAQSELTIRGYQTESTERQIGATEEEYEKLNPQQRKQMAPGMVAQYERAQQHYAAIGDTEKVKEYAAKASETQQEIPANILAMKGREQEMMALQMEQASKTLEAMKQILEKGTQINLKVNGRQLASSGSGSGY